MLLCAGDPSATQAAAVLVRVTGMAPLAATVWECERLRCNLCGEVSTAQAPEEVGQEKYDETAVAMTGLLKYGTGLPFHRIEKLQAGLGIPLPATTQWQLVEAGAKKLQPAFDERVNPDVLKQRAAELSAPIQMSDALAANVSGDFATLVAHCLAHARRGFVDVATDFPAECKSVLEALREVYRVGPPLGETDCLPQSAWRFTSEKAGR